MQQAENKRIRARVRKLSAASRIQKDKGNVEKATFYMKKI